MQIDDHAIARWRLANLRLTAPRGSVANVVADLLCVQAENHDQASWAVATRAAAATAQDVALAFDRGDILRTHVLRPTWHFVTPSDIGWLLDLTGPRIWPSSRRMATEFGLDADRLVKAAGVIVAAIEADGPLRRRDLAERLEAERLPSSGQGFGRALEFAEVQGLICSGPVIEDEHTHALLSDRAPHTRRLERDDALAELAMRYLQSHGPATAADLAYWASLTLSDARAGIGAIDGDLEHFDHDGRTFWHVAGTVPPDPPEDPTAHILQILDECYRGYQDSRWVLDAAGLVPRTREKAIGMVLIDAQIAAAMRRTVRSSHVRFEIAPFRRLSRPDRAAVQAEADRYAAYLGRDSDVVWQPSTS